MGKRSNFERQPRDLFGDLNPSYKHGNNCRGKRTTEYEIWVGIRKRCDNPKDKLYPYYGGRGVSYDPAWSDFLTFLNDVGKRPSKEFSLDRIDNNKNYTKDNVRWATRKEQSSNRRNNIIIDGLTLKDWSTEKGFNYKTVWRWFVIEHKTKETILEKGASLWGNTATT